MAWCNPGHVVCMNLSMQNKVKPYGIRNIQLQFTVHETAATIIYTTQTITIPTQYNNNSTVTKTSGIYTTQTTTITLILAQ